MTEKRPPIKKRPGIVRRGAQPETINKVAARVAAAESTETQEYDVRQIPLSHIQLWDEQPRTFFLTIVDIYRGFVVETDEHALVKKDELEGVIGLAMSIKEFGMLNVPLAYALPGKQVQLMGGQRRTMAAIFALFHIQSHVDENNVIRHEVEINAEPDLTLLDNERIAVKCYTRKPDDLMVERIGMTDNVQRSEVPIPDRLRWIVKYADKVEARGRELTWQDMSDTLGVTRSRAFDWLKVVKNRNDKWVRKVIVLVSEGTVSFKKLTEIVSTEPQDRQKLFESWYVRKPKKERRVSLGATSSLNALQHLVLNNVEGEEHRHFSSVNWDKPSEVKQAFSEFLRNWEQKYG